MSTGERQSLSPKRLAVRSGTLVTSVSGSEVERGQKET